MCLCHHLVVRQLSLKNTGTGLSLTEQTRLRPYLFSSRRHGTEMTRAWVACWPLLADHEVTDYSRLRNRRVQRTRLAISVL